MWVTRTTIPIVCRETVVELLRVLAYPKFKLTEDERETLLDYLPFAEIVPLPYPLPELPIACPDRSDVVLLWLALSAGADALISGDKDLTVLAGVLPVFNPTMLRQRLQQR